LRVALKVVATALVDGGLWQRSIALTRRALDSRGCALIYIKRLAALMLLPMLIRRMFRRE
jgi:hypothetical protein